MLIRPMKTDDINAVVAVHQASFQGFFLSALGKKFLSELYLSMLDADSSMMWVYEESGRIEGFVAGVKRTVGLYAHLFLSRWWRFIVAAIRPIIMNPLILLRLFRSFKKDKSLLSDENVGLLMSMAVLPDNQGRGIGKKLINAFLGEARKQKLTKVYLHTDRLENEAVNTFYQKCGFVLREIIISPEGREMCEYEFDLLEDVPGTNNGVKNMAQ